MSVTIKFTSGDTHEIKPGPESMALVRASFNPSGKEEVDAIKLLAAALIAEINAYKANPTTARHASLAITAVEEGAMWAVKAATAGS